MLLHFRIRPAVKESWLPGNDGSNSKDDEKSEVSDRTVF